ncbi:hypothetical protein [uncultured Microbulbifer sp.]|uniref:hypothetical protein n=1 Tax=uncultured Microbulbifer sp. TaxID=348147 RepID=UPI0025DD722D|nr:hypothetical protein [uncultured Microbulbifer sp.]
MNKSLLLLWGAFLLSVSSVGFAVEREFGDWSWDYADGGTIAMTFSDTGKGLAQVCNFGDGNCLYKVMFPVTCELGGTYPVLVSTDSAAYSMNMQCLSSDEEGGIYGITPFDDIDQIIREGNRIGIVMAMEHGSFSVVRFSLQGSNAAMDDMLENFLVARKARSARERRVSGDQFL